MTTGIKITFSINPEDNGALLTVISSAPSGIKVYGAKDFAKHTRYIIRFRNYQQIDNIFTQFGKVCKGKYVFLKKPKRERLKVYLKKPATNL
jgi:hypothetical protein